MTTEGTPRNRPVWEAESTHPQEAAKLETGLREVMDPEIGLSIIQLGLIRNVKIGDNQAHIQMILTTPFCPYGPALIDITRKKAEEALGHPAVISLGMEVWDFAMMEEGLADDWGMY
jgi:metal-sulfur cluster biosynthetic enzyme